MLHANDKVLTAARKQGLGVTQVRVAYRNARSIFGVASQLSAA
jgi:hypothetical protein